MTARSHLYVPGDRADVLAKALDRGADALIVDLEDAVPMAGKDAARDTVVGWLATVPPGSAEIWVRVNAGGLGLVDVGALASSARLTGFCLAKTETAADVEAVSDLLDELGSDAALAPLVESAAALLRAESIAAAPRVRRLQVGEADLRADTGILPGPEERELLWVRSWVVLVSAAAGLEPPVGPVSTDFRDLDALTESTEALRRMGYRGRACIHPAQVEVVNAVFTPSAEELDTARRVVSSYEAALAEGSGIVLGDDGRMIDEAVVRQARRLLS